MEVPTRADRAIVAMRGFFYNAGMKAMNCPESRSCGTERHHSLSGRLLTRFCLVASIVFSIPGLSLAQEETPDPLRVLGDEANRALEDQLMRQFHTAVDARKEAYEQIESRADCERWQRERREFFLNAIGGLPERTPLQARTVGELRGEGYRVEKVLFQSRPGFHVTGNLYLPDGDGADPGPWPGVLVPCGHSHNGKAAGGYQRTAILLARHGMAALCYDPIGQGERYQSLDFEQENEFFPSLLPRKLETPHPRVRFLCTVEHTMMGIGSILLGSNVAQYRIWDGMRAIDYLQSRDDILADRIGCVGNSGGGTLTAYLGALDDRIVATMPVCYLTTFRRLIETKGPQDGEQNLFGQIAFGMDEADYVMMRAPRPTLIGASTRDATFDIGGTWDLFREAKRFYTRLGYPERVDLSEPDLRHGMYLPHREAAARWMHRWLRGSEKDIREVDPATLPDPITDEQWLALSEGDWTQEELYCTPEGQVLLMPGERSVFEINAAIESQLRPDREARWGALSDEEKRALVRETIGGSDNETVAPPRLDTVGTIVRDGYRIDKVVLRAGDEDENRIDLPGLLFVPETPKPDALPLLYLHGESMKTEAGPGGVIERWVREEGRIVLAAELRGIGETETGHGKPDYGRGRFGPDSQEIYLAYLLGQSYVGLRVDDVRRWTAAFREAAEPSEPIELHASGEAAIPALHAAAISSDDYARVRLERMIPSWADLLPATVSLNQLVNSVHGALHHYDLPDLVRLAGRGRVELLSTVDAAGERKE